MPIQRAKPKFTDVKNVSIAAASLPAGSIIKTETTPFTDFGTIDLTTVQMVLTFREQNKVLLEHFLLVKYSFSII